MYAVVRHVYSMNIFILNLILHFTLRREINIDGCDVRVKGF